MTPFDRRKAKEAPLTAEALRKELDYDPATGVFRWRTDRRAGNWAKAGALAGSIDGDGYLVIKIGGIIYLGHRLAWLYTTGAWPEDQVDHVNGQRADNCFANLREATIAENSRNRRGRSKSGRKGVAWHKGTRKWRAKITLDGQTHYLGNFKDIETASAAYEAAARSLFGRYAYNGLRP